MISKKSTVFYHEWYNLIKTLSADKRLKLFELLFDENIADFEINDVHLKGIYDFINSKIQENNQRYIARCEQNRLNASKGGKAKFSKRYRSLAIASESCPNDNDDEKEEEQDQENNHNDELKKENLLPKVPLQKKESAKTSFALDFKKLSEENQKIGLPKYNEMRLKAQLSHDQIQEYLDKFDEFWRSYTPIKDKEGAIVPRGDKKNCRLRYLRLLYSGEKHVEIMKGLEIYLKVCITAKRQSVGAAVFLNQERWRSDYIGEVIETPEPEAPYTSHIRQTIQACNEAMAKHAERERLKQKQDS